MKYVITLIGVALIAACNTSRDKIRAFIPGIYVMDYEQEYSKGHDTLIFTLVSKEGNSYLITRRTSYNRITNGKVRPTEQKIEEMAGIYNEQDKVIREARHGRAFAFSPERNIALFGTEEYKKIY